MRVKLLTAVIAGLLVAGCGGGGDDDGAIASTTPTGSSGVSGGGSTDGTGTSGGAAATPTPVSASDAQYLTETAQATESQTQQSQAVAQKSSNPDVLILARQLTNEVNVINQQITQISQTNNVTINNNVTNQQQTQINTINNLSGTALDRAYVTGLIDSWRALLAATLVQVRQGTDVQVKQTASANVLTIEQRLVAAEEVLAILLPTQYLVDAYQNGLLEIQLSQVALQKATNVQVKQFAQQMIDDHTRVNTQLTALAQQKSVTLPSALTADKQEIIALVSSFSGADFDRAYMDRNVLTHAEAVSKATTVSERSSDAEIKAFAAQIVPDLQAHIQLAQSIATSLQASQLYQLGQSLVTEIQIAQLAQARSTSTQIKTLAQQIIAENQASYSQLVQLSQQRNASIPIVIPPGRVQAVLQLLRITGADLDRLLLLLISDQTTQSLQTVQAAQTSGDTGISSFAQTRASVLQTRAAQLTSAGGATSSTATPAATDTATTGTPGTGSATTDTATTGTPGTGTATTDGITTGTPATGTTTTGTTTTDPATTGTAPTSSTTTPTTGTPTTGTSTTGTSTPGAPTTGTSTTGTSTTGTTITDTTTTGTASTDASAVTATGEPATTGTTGTGTI